MSLPLLSYRTPWFGDALMDRGPLGITPEMVTAGVQAFLAIYPLPDKEAAKIDFANAIVAAYQAMERSQRR